MREWGATSPVQGYLRLEDIAREKKVTHQVDKEGWNTRRGLVRDATWLHGTAARCLVALTVLPTIWSPPSLGDAQPCLALLLVTLLASHLSSIASGWGRVPNSYEMNVPLDALPSPEQRRGTTLRMRHSTLTSTPPRVKPDKIIIGGVATGHGLPDPRRRSEPSGHGC